MGAGGKGRPRGHWHPEEAGGTSEALGGLPSVDPFGDLIHFPSKLEVVIQFPRAVDWIP